MRYGVDAGHHTQKQCEVAYHQPRRELECAICLSGLRLPQDLVSSGVQSIGCNAACGHALAQRCELRQTLVDRCLAKNAPSAGMGEALSERSDIQTQPKSVHLQSLR